MFRVREKIYVSVGNSKQIYFYDHYLSSSSSTLGYILYCRWKNKKGGNSNCLKRLPQYNLSSQTYPRKDWDKKSGFMVLRFLQNNLM